MNLPTLPAPRLGDRALFPDLEARAFLNHAAISPPSEPVRAVAHEVVGDYARKGVGAFLKWRDRREGLRARLGRLIGVGAEDIGFVANTTTGVSTIALDFPWRRGDRVIGFRGEFPTNITPWQQATVDHGVEVVLLDADTYRVDPAAGLRALETELRQGARLVAVSAVQFQTGLRMPLEAITRLAHAHGAQVFVDAIQALGVVPLDARALGVDYLACGSHKWLMGLEGCGFLYIRPDRVGELVPRTAGWLSHEEPIRFLVEGEGHLRYDRPIRRKADFVETGALNGVGLAALDASVGLIEQLGVEAIYQHVQAWHDRIEPQLVERGFASMRAPWAEGRSGSLSLRPPQGTTAMALAAALAERGVAVSTPDGLLRLAPHWPNGLGEVERVVEAVDEALAAARG